MSAVEERNYENTAVDQAALDEVMKKYDRESNTRVWEGWQKGVVWAVMAAFSLFVIYVTLFATWLDLIRYPSFMGGVLLIGYLVFPAKKGVQIYEQYATAIPVATAVAQSFDTDFAKLCGDIVGSEMEVFGVDLWLAPALNIHRNVLCGRNFEYYSEDPLLSGKMAAAMTGGVQSHKGCGVTLKHYAANNQETNRYASNSMVSERAMREIYLRGFEICVRESDPAAVMTSYNLLNGVHTCESRELVTAVLRDEMGFDGLVMTDWWVGGDMLLNRKSKYGTPDPALVAASGHSLFMPGCRKDLRRIMAGLKKGTVTRKQLEENAFWLIHVAGRLGK